MSSTLSQTILDLILSIGNYAGTEDLDSGSREHQLTKIDLLIAWGHPIHMILPAFPAKSPNPQKTVSHRPDYGEVLALKKLNQLGQRITEVYAPGADITICSDGRVFSDVVQVCDRSVDIYGRDIKEIISEHELSHLNTFSLDDVFSSHNYDLMRSRLMSDHAESLESLRSRIQNETEAKLLFNGIHRFMFEDQLAMNPGCSRNQMKEKSKHLAYEVIRRSNAWSRLVEIKFPDSVRLSIHPQAPSSKKIGVRLLPSKDLWRTPWHSVTLFDGKNYSLVPRAQAEAAGAALKFANDKYPYYTLGSEIQTAVS